MKTIVQSTHSTMMIFFIVGYVFVSAAYAQDFTPAEVQQLKAILPYIRLITADISGVRGPHIIFEGVNVHVRSGSGYTNEADAPTGLGNFIIGYDEQNFGPHQRTGAHNFVMGPEHTFTSVGGLVVGFGNTISGP